MEKLAKLTPEAKEFTERIDNGNFEGLSASDIAAALAKIKGDDAPSCLMRFKYADDVREGRKVLARIKGVIITSCDVPEHMNTDMALLVLEDAFMPQHCRCCHGRKEVMSGELKIICRVCNGSGVGRRNDAHMAQALHVTIGEWRDHYKGEYCNLMRIVGAWESAGRKAMLDALLFN